MNVLRIYSIKSFITGERGNGYIPICANSIIFKYITMYTNIHRYIQMYDYVCIYRYIQMYDNMHQYIPVETDIYNYIEIYTNTYNTHHSSQKY